MKLYYAPGTCSLSPQIVLLELGLPFTLVRVDHKAHRTADGGDYYAINPKGYVPALELDDGRRLTEGPAIVQYLADRKPEAALVPPNGTFERAQLQEWLNFVSTEIHKNYGALFNADMPQAAKKLLEDKLVQRYGYVARMLEGRAYLLGAQFSVADAYLFTVTRWARAFDIDVARWPALAQYMARVGARPAVAKAVRFETEAKKAA